MSAQEVIMSGEALYNTNFSLINGSIMGATIKSSKGKDSSASKITPAKLDFTRSETLSKTIQKDFIANLSKDNFSLKTSLENVFSDNKLRNDFDRLLASYGYSGKNLADAMTAYLIISWQVIHGQQYNDRKGFDAVRKMVRENLLSNSYLNTVTDKEKQIATETFGYQSMIAMNTYKVLVAGRKNQELENFKSTIDKKLKKLGMDLKKVRLTSSGFINSK